MGGQIFTLGSAAPQKHGHQADPGKDKKKARRAEAGADMSPRVGFAPEAVMSDEDDWDFAGADDAKMKSGRLTFDNQTLPTARGDIPRVLIEGRPDRTRCMGLALCRD